MKKSVIFFLFLFLVSCVKDDFEPEPIKNLEVDIFTQTDVKISDGDEVLFFLPSDSVYVLRLVDKETNQTISKEKIQGKIGQNKIKIYTKSIQSKYLFLVLEGINKNQINKTTIIVK